MDTDLRTLKKLDTDQRHTEGPDQRVGTDQGPGPEVIELFSCSTQLSLKFQILINTEIAQIYCH